VASTH